MQLRKMGGFLQLYAECGVKLITKCSFHSVFYSKYQQKFNVKHHLLWSLEVL